MSGYVLFQMHSSQRERFIEKHEFFVEQAKARLLQQFTDDAIKAEAERTAEESYEVRGRDFNPDYDDHAESAQAAFEDGAWRYKLLCELRDQTRLNIVAAFFHEWEKNIRQWLVDQLNFWHQETLTKEKLWTMPLSQVLDLFDSFEWDLKKSSWFASLDACRLVVNVHKHGDGSSLKTLRTNYPSFLVDPFSNIRLGEFSISEMNHKNLKVCDDGLGDFANAITEFWRGVPEDTTDSQITEPPSWFVKALGRDF